MAVLGHWWTYSITLAWSDFDGTLRVFFMFEMNPPSEKISVYTTL
tara:strand:+ start:527 stop:661 length:135 start_codon:yes stop_codon:yes gene_type:complete